MDHHHIVRAASSKAAVFANWVDSGPIGACRLESKRWRGAGWKDVRPIQGLPDCDVHALVPLPGGGAVIGFKNSGVYRLL